MHARHSVPPIFVVIAALAVPRAVASQQVPGAPPAAAPAAAPAPCASTLTLNSLESNNDVLTAAEGLAGQIVGNYNENRSKGAPEMNGFWGPFNRTLLEGIQPACASTKAVEQASSQTAITKATTSQTNTQTGTSGSGSGSTSAAQKVGIPQLLAVAVENGAIADSVSGTTMTLSTTPYGFAYAFAKNQDTEERYQDEAVLTHTGISATFNIADTADPLQSASRKAISQWQIKYTFRDTSSRSSAVNYLYHFGTPKLPKPADRAAAEQNSMASKANAVVANLSNRQFYVLRSELGDSENAAYLGAWTSTLEKLVVAQPAATDTDQLQKREGIATALLQLLDKDPAFQQALLSVSADLKKPSSNLAVLVSNLEASDTAYARAEEQFESDVKNLTKGWNGDFTFSQKFPSPTTTSSSGSSTSATTTISPPAYLAPELDIAFDPETTPSAKAGVKGDTSSGKGQCAPTFTGNFSGGFYSNPKSSLHETTFRGTQVALQFQWNLGGGPFTAVKSAGDESKMTLGFSGNYQRMQENEDQKGKRPDIVTGSVRLEVPIASGASFPLAVTFGNATSQAKGNYVLGNFGISFDLDALAALAKLKR
jgi:hypothetical protein